MIEGPLNMGVARYVQMGPPPGWRAKGISRARRFKHIILSSEIRPGMEDLVGSKSVGLAMMEHQLNLSVPEFFVVSSEAMRFYLAKGSFPQGFNQELDKALKLFEGRGKLSVRAAGPVNMPGLLGTELEIGSKDALYEALDRVAKSWGKEGVAEYLALRGQQEACLAAVVQVMVFGDKDKQSATGIFHTIDPVSGKGPSARVLIRAQGPAVMTDSRPSLGLERYLALFPAQAGELVRRVRMFHSFFGGPQKIEFTQEGGRLFYLQTDLAEMSPLAALRAARDLVQAGIISRRRAAGLFTPWHEALLLAPTLDGDLVSPGQMLKRGLGVVPGIGSGRVSFDLEALRESGNGILVKSFLVPEDYLAISMSNGVVAFTDEVGAHTSALALGLMKPAIARVQGIRVDLTNRVLVVQTSEGPVRLTEEDVISIDGTTGMIYRGEIGRRESVIADLVKKIGRAFPAHRYQVQLDAPREERLTAIGVLEIRDWRDLPRKEEDRPQLVPWPEIRARAAAIPEIRDFPREVLEVAANLLAHGRLSVDIIYQELQEMERVEPGKWGYRVAKEAQPRGMSEDVGDFGQPLILYEKGRQLLYALYYLDPEPTKKVCRAMFYVPAGIHDETYQILTSLSDQWLVRFIDGRVSGAYQAEVPFEVADYFFVCTLYGLAQEREHQGLLNKIKPETLAFFLEGGWGYSHHPKADFSQRVKTRMPKMEAVSRFLATVEPARLKRAVGLIKNPRAKNFWQSEISK